MLDKKYHVDALAGCTVRYVKSDTERFVPHYHNYYEIFLVIHGSVKHFINGTVQNLCEGSLLFIRDFDTHDYAKLNNDGFDFINMSFEKTSLTELFSYLGDGFSSEALLNAKMPPYVVVSNREKEKLFYSLTELNSYENKKIEKTKMRSLLLNIFTSYFENYSEEESDIPLWLELSYEKMKRPENFIVGSERWIKITGKSREYISRSMHKYYGCTPTEFITELRLNYAVNLMRTSNLSITDICFECGFSNLSWFYKIFEAKYYESPAKYRKGL